MYKEICESYPNNATSHFLYAQSNFIENGILIPYSFISEINVIIQEVGCLLTDQNVKEMISVTGKQ